MKKWMSSVREFLSDEAASTAIEYGLIASLVGLVMAVGATALGNDLSAMFTAIGGKLTIK
jgi:pilus assembly protein Flp/PilA